VSFFSRNERERFLVIAPHCDDEIFGCAGLMARAIEAGHEVAVIIVSNADIAQYRQQHGVARGADRKGEMVAGLKELGVWNFEILFEDPGIHMRLDQLPMIELVTKIERTARLSIDAFKPTILLLPALSYNQDHDVVHKAGIAACRPHLRHEKHFVSTVLIYDQPQLCWGSDFTPNFYVDIEAWLPLKLASLRHHGSQLRGPPHHASLENVERLARLRGAAISCGAAEAFQCIRMTC
jgi:N-acetylglucosamine malate deacetylase 1